MAEPGRSGWTVRLLSLGFLAAALVLMRFVPSRYFKADVSDLAPRTAGAAAPAPTVPQQNPLVGSWRQAGWKPCKPLAVVKPENIDWNLEELEFKPDGTYAVTWTPFETYKDYWGHYTFSITGARPPSQAGRLKPSMERTWGAEYWGRIELVIEHGNYIPGNFAGKGSFRIEGKQLTLTNVKLGTRHAKEPLDLCEMTFVRY